MSKKTILGIVSGALLLASLPAAAQYYYPAPPPPPYGGGYYRPPPPPAYGYEQPRYDGYYRRQQPAYYGSTCVTSRGACEANPAPYGARCRCMIDGFGLKRGAIR